MKKKKLKKLPTLKNTLWKLMSRVVRQVYANHDGYVTCVCCNRGYHWKEIDAGHFIPRARGSGVYFDWFNVHPQCKACNKPLWNGEMGKIWYYEWMLSAYGSEEIDRLKRLSHGTGKWDRGWLEDQIEHYKACELELS